MEMITRTKEKVFRNTHLTNEQISAEQLLGEAMRKHYEFIREFNVVL